MDNPEKEIRAIVHRLTQGSPEQQESAINTYFTADAILIHPFCRTGSFEGSRYLIKQIYKWYKIMSPRIELNVNSIGEYAAAAGVVESRTISPKAHTRTAYDKENMLLYVTISQIFAIWFIPFHRSEVTLTSVLQLVHKPGSRKYFIQSQNDLYSVDQFFQFFLPWGIGTTIVVLFHFWATFMCVLGANLGRPITNFMQSQWVKRQARNVRTNGVSHSELAREEVKVKELLGTGATPQHY
jgi:hypothetical protein